METEERSGSAAQSSREGAVWIGLSLLVCPGLPFVVLEVAALVGLDLEPAAIVALGTILAAVATGRWIMLGRSANGTSGRVSGASVIRRALPLVCPMVVALWAFVIVTDAALVPYSLILVPLVAALVICGPVATSVVSWTDPHREHRSSNVRRCVLSLVQFPLSAFWRSTVSIAETLKPGSAS